MALQYDSTTNPDYAWSQADRSLMLTGSPTINDPRVSHNIDAEPYGKATKTPLYGIVTSDKTGQDGLKKKYIVPLYRHYVYKDDPEPVAGYKYVSQDWGPAPRLYKNNVVIINYYGPTRSSGQIPAAGSVQSPAMVSATTQRTYNIDTSESAASTAANVAASAENRQFLLDLTRRRTTFYSGQALVDTQAMLAKMGYTQAEINAYVRAQTDAERRRVDAIVRARKAAQTSVGGGGGSTGGGSGSRAGSSANPAANFGPVSNPQLQTRLVVRMPSGFTVPNPAELAAITKPAINQVFTDPSGKVFSYTYIFDFIPNNIQYSGLGSEWVEIPRAENFAFVDWSRYQLMKVSMSWVVATDRVEDGGAIVNDGLFNSVDSNIATLRRMAQRKYPVSIVNMDDLLSVQLKADDNNPRSVRGMQFVITDLSVTASRRTGDPSTGGSTSPSKIAVAQVNMTLQECPIESVQIISMPTLSIPFTPPSAPGSSGNPLGPNYNLASGAFVVTTTPPPTTQGTP